MKALIAKIKTWWRGELLPARPYVLDLDRYKRPLLVRIVEPSLVFLRDNWHKIVMALIALAGLVVAMFK